MGRDGRHGAGRWDGAAAFVLPSTYKLDPTTGQLSVLVANGQDAVISPDRTRVAYVRDLDRDLCLYRDPWESAGPSTIC